MEFFFVFFIYFFYFGIIALIIFAFYKIGDNWVNKNLEVKREHNELLKEILEIMKERK